MQLYKATLEQNRILKMMARLFKFLLMQIDTDTTTPQSIKSKLTPSYLQIEDTAPDDHTIMCTTPLIIGKCISIVDCQGNVIKKKEDVVCYVTVSGPVQYHTAIMFMKEFMNSSNSFFSFNTVMSVNHGNLSG